MYLKLLNNKKIIYFIPFSFIVTLLNCENREDPFKTFNNPPTLTFNNKKDIIYDTVKINFQDFITKNLYINDEADSINIKGITKNEQLESFKYNRKKLKFGKKYTVPNKKSPEYQLQLTQINNSFNINSSVDLSIKYFIEDGYGNEDKLKHKIHVFKNQPPKAKLKIKKLKNISEKEVKISAAFSYDRDSGYGGKIIKFQYIIDNYKVNTKKDNINFNFHNKGQHIISLKIKDNNNFWSKMKSDTIYFN